MEIQSVISKFVLILLLPSLTSSSSQNHQEIDSARYILTNYFQNDQNFHESSFQRYLSSFPTCDSPIPFLSVARRELIGEGYHRDLLSSFKFTNHSDSCKAILIEILPPSVFADPFELHRRLHRGDFDDALVAGDTNLELPAFLSNRTLVEIHMNIIDSSKEEIELHVPIHARYPPLVEEGYYTAEIELPYLLMKCSNAKQQHILCKNGVHFEGRLLWKIPSGKIAHTKLVSIVTFFTSFSAAFAIVYVSLKRGRLNSK